MRYWAPGAMEKDPVREYKVCNGRESVNGTGKAILAKGGELALLCTKADLGVS